MSQLLTKRISFKSFIGNKRTPFFGRFGIVYKENIWEETIVVEEGYNFFVDA